MAIKVTVRQKEISNGRYSLFLDFYPHIKSPKTGKLTRREYLGIYIKKNPKTHIEKKDNKESIDIANSISSKRKNELNKPEIYTGYELEQLKIKERGEQDFLEYFEKLMNKREASTYNNWVSAHKYLKAFTNGSIKFSELSHTFFDDFKEYLLTTKSTKSSKKKLSQNSASSYFNKVKATLKQAYKDEYLSYNLNERVGSIKPEETQRNFLTFEELNQLIKTKCKNPQLKTVGLFSALTGLRFSDIKNMEWGDVEYIKGNGYFIKFKHQKTKSIEMLPIPEQAFELMGERKEINEKVFEGLKYSAHQNKYLYTWFKDAGITKKITFHCLRHTYATLQLSLGTDLYTVSKMLGHKDLKTTQIYAKIIDQTKRDTTNKIKLDF